MLFEDGTINDSVPSASLRSAKNDDFVPGGSVKRGYASSYAR
jgi:hypothetical protein